MTHHRTLARTVVTAALVLWAPAALLACPVCFQVEDGPVVSGVRAAVGVLMGVTGVVLVGFGMFAVRLTRAEPENPKTSAFANASADKREPEHARTRVPENLE